MIKLQRSPDTRRNNRAPPARPTLEFGALNIMEILENNAPAPALDPAPVPPRQSPSPPPRLPTPNYHPDDPQNQPSPDQEFLDLLFPDEYFHPSYSPGTSCSTPSSSRPNSPIPVQDNMITDESDYDPDYDIDLTIHPCNNGNNNDNTPIYRDIGCSNYLMISENFVFHIQWGKLIPDHH